METIRTALFFIILAVFMACSSGEYQSQKTELSPGDSLFNHPAIYPPEILFQPEISLPIDFKLTDTMNVYVEAWVDTLGNVSDLQILKGHDPFLDSLALEYARMFRFSSGRMEEKPKRMKIGWRIQFTPNR